MSNFRLERCPFGAVRAAFWTGTQAPSTGQQAGDCNCGAHLVPWRTKRLYTYDASTL